MIANSAAVMRGAFQIRVPIPADGGSEARIEVIVIDSETRARRAEIVRTVRVAEGPPPKWAEKRLAECRRRYRALRVNPRRAIERALVWLAAHQSPNGGWEAAGFGNWCDGVT